MHRGEIKSEKLCVIKLNSKMAIYIWPRLGFYIKYKGCDVCLRICTMTTAVSKPSINIKCGSAAKLSVNLALNAMKKKIYFPLPYFERLPLFKSTGSFLSVF